MPTTLILILRRANVAVLIRNNLCCTLVQGISVGIGNMSTAGVVDILGVGSKCCCASDAYSSFTVCKW